MFGAKIGRLVSVATQLKDALEFSRLDGGDGLSRNGEYRVTVLSRRGDIQADELLGHPVSVVLTTPHAGTREFNGLAVGAAGIVLSTIRCAASSGERPCEGSAETGGLGLGEGPAD